MTTGAVIVAAGRGTRAGGGLPKQWRDLAGRAVAAHTLDAFRHHPDVGPIALVLHPDDMGLGAGYSGHPDVTVAEGGATRRDSVLAGLEVLAPLAVDKVLIHDVARPLVSAKLISAVIDTLGEAAAAAPALGVTDALWRGENNRVTGTTDRAGLYRAQTPQGFHFDAILAAHRAHTADAADDVEVARASGLDVTIVEGEERNLKITTAQDFDRAEQLLRGHMEIRTGNGFDVHAFGAGDHVVLCGLKIPHDQGLMGHSDADVAMHTVTDAIYGAIAQGDIGRHFPPSDPQWLGAQSEIFLDHAVSLAGESGYTISNVDCTIICEYPKIGPHADAMQANMARIMNLAHDRVSIKATTSERLGFTGRREGIAALATVTLIKP